MTARRVFILSNGCKPTEDLYFKHHISTRLIKNNIVAEKYINCRKTKPNAFLKSLDSQDIVIFFRTLPATWCLFLSDIAKITSNVIYVLDDDLAAASKTPELPKKYLTKIKHFAENYQTTLLDNASLLIVSSDHLAKQYASYSPLRLNPCLLVDPTKNSFASSNSNSICYHATRSHERDLHFLEPVLNEILKSQYTSFESLIGNSTPVSLAKRKNVSVRQPKSWQSFKRFQRFAKRNIGLAPLLDTPYNRAKSHIKFLDYAAVGAVGIYSNREPYSLIVDHGVDGLLADDDPKEWQAHLEFLISNPGTAKNMAENAQNKAFKIGHPKHAYRFWRRLLASDVIASATNL